MIGRTKLKELHTQDLPLHVLEQDYVQALFLAEMYRKEDGLVFKGGTFLKHAHGLDRFSEDLDFTLKDEVDVVDVFRTVAERLERWGIPSEIDSVENLGSGVEARLRYRGPLYDGSDRSTGTIDLDVSTRGDLCRDPKWVRLFFPYPETRAVTALGMAVEEVLAEKLRALSTRTKGRDLYDTWFLLEQEVGAQKGLFQRKMEAVGESPVVVVTTTEKEWERDLGILLQHPPDYKDVKESVLDALEKAGIETSDSS